MARTWRVHSVAWGVSALLLVSGCGGGSGSGVSGSAVESGSGANHGGGASNGSGAETGKDMSHGGGATGNGSGNGSGGHLIISIGGSDSGGGSDSHPGDGTPEICDGVDNDSNGIIDDVDAGHDGVCDCLNIATIGHIGPWSNGGNVFKSWLNARSPLGAVELADDELTPDKLKKYQIVVVLHAATTAIDHNGIIPAHHAFADAEATAFGAWVQAGGGVMTTIGYTNDEASEVVNVNKLLSTMGMGYSPTKLDLGGDVKNWLPHPLSDGITNIHTNNGVEPDGTMGMTIAHSGDKVALQVSQAAKGRVAVWGDEWVTYDSEWADVDGQQVETFWLNLLKWLSPPTECQVPIPVRVR